MIDAFKELMVIICPYHGLFWFLLTYMAFYWDMFWTFVLLFIAFAPCFRYGIGWWRWYHETPARTRTLVDMPSYILLTIFTFGLSLDLMWYFCPILIFLFVFLIYRQIKQNKKYNILLSLLIAEIAMTIVKVAFLHRWFG